MISKNVFLVLLLLGIVLLSGCQQPALVDESTLDTVTDAMQNTGTGSGDTGDASNKTNEKNALPALPDNDQSTEQNVSGEESGITIQAATTLLINQVVNTSDNIDDMLIYTWPEQLQPGDLVTTEFGTVLAFRVDKPSWFFWIDDLPGAKFGHPNRFVLINAITEEVQVAETEFWPFINEYSMRHDLAGFDASVSGSHGVITSVETETVLFQSTTTTTSDSSTGDQCPCDDPKKYALLISGEYDPKLGFTKDTTNLANHLNGEGYEVHHLRPQGISTTGGDATFYTGATTPANIKAQLEAIGAKKRCCDEIFIYFSTHGFLTDCTALQELYQGLPSGKYLDFEDFKGAVEGQRGIGGVGPSMVEQQGGDATPAPSGKKELCLKIDPPLKVKYQLEGVQARGIGGVTHSKIPELLPQEQKLGNPQGGFMSAADLDAILDGLEDCCNMTVVIDACHAGAGTFKLTDPGRTIIAATAAADPAFATKDGGLFTNWMLDKMKAGKSFNDILDEVDDLRDAQDAASEQDMSLLLGQQPKYSSTPCDKECCPASDGIDTTIVDADANATDADSNTTDTVSSCTEDWSCSGWSDYSWNACSGGTQSGSRTRTCTDANACGTTTSKPVESESSSQSCGDAVACTESWSCTEYGAWSAWGACQDSSTQSRNRTRTCTDANACGTLTSKPSESESESQACEYTPTTQKAEYTAHENALGSNIGTLSYSGDSTSFDLTPTGGEYGYKILNIPGLATIEVCVAANDPLYLFYYPQYHYGFDFTDTDPGCTQLYNKNAWAIGALLHLGDPNPINTTGTVTVTQIS